MIDDLKQFAKENKVPIIKDDGLTFLLQTIQKTNAKRILELGTAIGYSSIQMALLDASIEIDTIERDEAMYKEAIVNVKDADLENQIHLHFMDIKDFKTDAQYDLIFVDAAKGQYGRFMEQFYDNLREGGIFFFDNMIFHGLIYEVDQIKSRNTRQLVKKINKFRQSVQEDKRFDIMFYDNIGDGILILTKEASHES